VPAEHGVRAWVEPRLGGERLVEGLVAVIGRRV